MVIMKKLSSGMRFRSPSVAQSAKGYVFDFKSVKKNSFNLCHIIENTYNLCQTVPL